jgi:hypothetical protein
MESQRFDKRIVLGVVPRIKGQRKEWRVRCDCGHEFTCLTQDLHRGGPCILCGHKGPRPYRRKRPYEALYNAFVGRARHEVCITYEQFLLFTTIVACHYCGETIRWAKFRTKGKGSDASNLDRKDNDKPYIFDNIVVCCLRCNKAKNTHFTYEEWLQLGKVIRSWS